MTKNAKVYFDDILESIAQIEEYTSKINENEFSKNIMLQDAVVRRLEIIGEAVKQISPDFKEQYPDTSWKGIAGVRDILIHGYSSINLKKVLNVVKIDLPDLKKRAEKIIRDIEKQNK